MKERVLRKEIADIMQSLLKKDGIAHEITIKNGACYCRTSLSSRRYHAYIERAMCQLQQGSKKTPVISLNELLRINQNRSFVLLSKDNEKALSIM